jgi:hypothetical protein
VREKRARAGAGGLFEGHGGSMAWGREGRGMVGVSVWRREKVGVLVCRGRVALSETAARAAEAGWQTGEGGGARTMQGDGARAADVWAWVRGGTQCQQRGVGEGGTVWARGCL